MTAPSQGIHHVTAVAGEPQRNLDFYAGTLGMRFIKRTVNFDDPNTYHLYYGDRTGTPGTLLTFFPWAGAPRGRNGAGEAVVTSFAVPHASLAFWQDRLGAAGVVGVTSGELFGQRTLQFQDPDGMGLALVGSAGGSTHEDGVTGPISGAAAIRRIHGMTLRLRSVEPTSEMMQEVLGFRSGEEDNGVRRLHPAQGASGGVLDLIHDPAAPLGSMGAGSVHHIAWRAADDAHQLRLRGEVLGRSLSVTPVVDRQYFRSIYFREPGGVLFEIATDGPGFMIDEPEATLGEALKLPPQYESQRAAIQAHLVPLQVPGESHARSV